MVCIASSSDNKDIAANLLSFQMSDEGLAYVMGSALSLPCYKDLMTNEAYVNTPPSTTAFINSASYLGIKEQLDACQTGKFPQFQSIVYAQLSDAFEGVITLDEAVANIDELCNTTVFVD